MTWDAAEPWRAYLQAERLSLLSMEPDDSTYGELTQFTDFQLLSFLPRLCLFTTSEKPMVKVRFGASLNEETITGALQTGLHVSLQGQQRAVLQIQFVLLRFTLTQNSSGLVKVFHLQFRMVVSFDVFVLAVMA